MKFFFRFLFEDQIDPLSDYESMLAKVLRWVLFVLIVIGIPAVTVGVIEAVKLNQPVAGLFYVVFFLPLIGVAIFQKHLNYKLSAAIVLFCLFLFAVHNATVFGFSGAGLPIFLTFFILVTVFYGRKAGIFSLILGVLAMGVIGFLMVHGILSVQIDLMDISTQPVSWITAISVLFLLGALMVLGYSFIQGNFLKITRVSREQAEELRKMNENLKREIQHKEEIHEQLQEAKEKAEESDRLKSAFLKNMSHEIRTPMNGIMGFASLLEDNQIEREKVHEYVHLIKDSGYTLLNMINLSLDLYKMEQGTYTLHPQPVDLARVVRRIFLQLKNETHVKQLATAVYAHGQTLAKEGQFWVRGDPLLCYSLFSNLIKNALEASPEGEEVSVHMEIQETRALIKVHNSGAVPREVREVFFDKLSTYGKKTGTGLGTYSAALMAKTMQGDIDMQTSEEKGTFVLVWLPVESAPQEGHPMGVELL